MNFIGFLAIGGCVFAFVIGIAPLHPYLLGAAAALNLPQAFAVKWITHEAHWHRGMYGSVILTLLTTIPGAILNVGIYFLVGFGLRHTYQFFF